MASDLSTDRLQLGQEVTCALHWAGVGIIVGIHGEQSPASIGSMGGGVVAYGGRATFDVAFESGHLSKQVPECIVRGIQWQIGERIADADEIIDAVQFCNAKAARSKEIEEAHKARRDEERTQHAAENPHLLKKSDRKDWGPGRLAAENLRRELKLAYPSVKFSITSDYNSVHIHWENGPTYDAVNKIGRKYEAGSFDGMDDCYKYDEDATFGDVFGDPKYVFPTRNYTVAALRQVWAEDGRDPAQIPDNFSQVAYTIDDIRERVMRLWGETDLTGKVIEPPPAPKAQGPFWSKRGLLATNESGWTREFRKVETAQKELDKLTAKGIKAEIVRPAASRANCVYIRRIDD